MVLLIGNSLEAWVGGLIEVVCNRQILGWVRPEKVIDLSETGVFNLTSAYFAWW